MHWVGVGSSNRNALPIAFLQNQLRGAQQCFRARRISNAEGNSPERINHRQFSAFRVRHAPPRCRSRGHPLQRHDSGRCARLHIHAPSNRGRSRDSDTRGYPTSIQVRNRRKRKAPNRDTRTCSRNKDRGSRNHSCSRSEAGVEVLRCRKHLDRKHLDHLERDRQIRCHTAGHIHSAVRTGTLAAHVPSR
jgi:hypothetical protein